jgi:hypothetical protein
MGQEFTRVFLASVADRDPGSGAFMTVDPGSGMVVFRISQTQIFDSLMTNFLAKSTIILSILADKNFFSC